MSGQTHIVGPAITWYNEADPDGPIIRQRCSWCGALIREDRPTQMMVPIADADRTIPDWPVGELIRLTGDGWPWIREILDVARDPTGEHANEVPLAEIAPDACMLLDPEVTR